MNKISIGEVATLTIDRFTSVGAFLRDEDNEEVLLPNKYLNPNLELDQEIDVFIYNDSEDRPVATTERPLIKLDDFAFLRVKDVSNFGAFLDWGMEKDLLVPFKEQTAKMVVDGVYLVRLIKDQQTNRLVGTARTNRYLSDQVDELAQGDRVDLFIGEITDLGRKVIVNNKYHGLIFKNHLVRPLRTGERTEGYISFIRQDGKLDISLVPIGIEKFDEFTQSILEFLESNGGTMTLNDKSHPDLIRDELGMSKKSFKKALGNLYKSRKIKISDAGVELV